MNLRYFFLFLFLLLIQTKKKIFCSDHLIWTGAVCIETWCRPFILPISITLFPVRLPFSSRWRWHNNKFDQNKISIEPKRPAVIQSDVVVHLKEKPMQRQKAVRDGPTKYEVHRVVTEQILRRKSWKNRWISFCVHFIRWKQHEKKGWRRKKCIVLLPKRFSLIVNRDTGQVFIYVSYRIRNKFKYLRFLCVNNMGILLRLKSKNDRPHMYPYPGMYLIRFFFRFRKLGQRFFKRLFTRYCWS